VPLKNANGCVIVAREMLIYHVNSRNPKKGENMDNKLHGYVIVRWEDEPPEKEGGYHKITFTVLDAKKDEKNPDVYIDVPAGSLRLYGKKVPKNLYRDIGELVKEAQYYQRTMLSKTTRAKKE
jgi:hypothetical protein